MSFEKGRRRWEAYVGLNGLDLLQLQDGIPWAITPGPFEAIFSIDVSHNRRYFGFSVLIVRRDGRQPHFRVWSDQKPKVDSDHEEINDEVLEQELVGFFEQRWLRTYAPLESVLFLRDGQLYQREGAALDRALQTLKKPLGIIKHDARIQAIEFFKRTDKELRMWDVLAGQGAQNVIEGTAITLSDKHCLLANTGRATLSQGTAEPVLLTSSDRRADLPQIAAACFQSAQLNWSSPRKAMRLPLPMERTDKDLIAKAQQEARHFK
jgi:hypothetical protein